jgi:hypothetical protein
MSNVILQFKTLSDLARFSKAVNPQAYIINTLQLTLTSCLSDFEIAIAMEEYEAMPVRQLAQA